MVNSIKNNIRKNNTIYPIVSEGSLKCYAPHVGTAELIIWHLLNWLSQRYARYGHSARLKDNDA